VNLSACACSGKNMARLLQPAVMAVLAEGPLHGYRVAQRLRGMAMFADQPADRAGLYRLLRSLEKRHLVTSTWDVSTAGPAKRCYELSAAGRECLAHWVDTLRTYHAAVSELLAVAQASRALRRRTGTRRPRRR
jgi:DNA-binding PadR family transcriptional regulator